MGITGGGDARTALLPAEARHWLDYVWAPQVAETHALHYCQLMRGTGWIMCGHHRWRRRTHCTTASSGEALVGLCVGTTGGGDARTALLPAEARHWLDYAS